jgi:hypothetical protein
MIELSDLKKIYLSLLRYELRYLNMHQKLNQIKRATFPTFYNVPTARGTILVG